MASVEKFMQLAAFYNQMTRIMSAICVAKGGIDIENYVGRFFAADVLQFVAEYGKKLQEVGADARLAQIVEAFSGQAEKVKDLATPSQKPIYEMTLAEFERLMNVEQ